MRKLDPFLLSLIGAILLATFLPCYGQGAMVLSSLTTLCIAIMFFLQGARLEPKAVLESVRDWRLQGSVLGCTFLMFPLLGIALHALMPGVLKPDMWRGVLFLCCLPSTVQSSIALTSIARGNVPASICAATLSNLAGIVATPILVTLVIQRGNVWSGQAIIDIATQLLLPSGSVSFCIPGSETGQNATRSCSLSAIAGPSCSLSILPSATPWLKASGIGSRCPIC